MHLFSAPKSTHSLMPLSFLGTNTIGWTHTVGSVTFRMIPCFSTQLTPPSGEGEGVRQLGANGVWHQVWHLWLAGSDTVDPSLDGILRQRSSGSLPSMFWEYSPLTCWVDLPWAGLRLVGRFLQLRHSWEKARRCAARCWAARGDILRAAYPGGSGCALTGRVVLDGGARGSRFCGLFRPVAALPQQFGSELALCVYVSTRLEFCMFRLSGAVFRIDTWHMSTMVWRRSQLQCPAGIFPPVAHRWRWLPPSCRQARLRRRLLSWLLSWLLSGCGGISAHCYLLESFPGPTNAFEMPRFSAPCACFPVSRAIASCVAGATAIGTLGLGRGLTLILFEVFFLPILRLPSRLDVWVFPR